MKMKSKTTDLIVEVVKLSEGMVYYFHPDFNGLSECAEKEFFETMDIVPMGSVKFHRDQVDFGAFGL